MNAETKQYCTFTLDDRLYGVDALQVQEIVRTRMTTPVPLAADAVVGLMNLRGQIVTVLDVRSRLGMEPRQEPPSAIVVVQTADGAIGLSVDEIGDVVDVNDSQVEPPPDTFRGEAKAFVLGACKLPGRLLLTLDLDKIVAP